MNKWKSGRIGVEGSFGNCVKPPEAVSKKRLLQFQSMMLLSGRALHLHATLDSTDLAHPLDPR